MSGTIRIGTSGWHYNHWRGKFYPDDLPQDRWLAHYAESFDTVEINNSFYQLPGDDTMDAWRDQAPAGFLFAVKASRYLTHMRKLNEPEEPLEKFLKCARRLKRRLGPLLYQLPPRWKKNLERLRAFAEKLPEDRTHVIEFRDRDWLADDTYELLDEFGIALCVHDMLPRHPRRLTGPIAYVRFHGTGRKYGGSYSPSRLQPWAEWISEAAQQCDVYVYFNNDADGHAVRNAQTLKELLGQ